MVIIKVRAGTVGDDNCSLQCLEQAEALKRLKRSGVKDLPSRTHSGVLTLNTPPPLTPNLLSNMQGL